MNFWPIGGLLRRGGTFFLRRRFAGNRLYASVFAEYLQYLVGAGYPVSFYLEGGRSRTGQLLKPKIGLLSMVAETPESRLSKPIAIIPIYIGYDKIVEGGTYLKEIRGRSKKGESWRQLLRARKLIRYKFGHAYLAFGEAVKLGSDFTATTDGGNGRSCPRETNRLANQIMTRINASMVVSPTGLIALIMFSTPNNAFVKRFIAAT